MYQRGISRSTRAGGDRDDVKRLGSEKFLHPGCTLARFRLKIAHGWPIERSTQQDEESTTSGGHAPPNARNAKVHGRREIAPTRSGIARERHRTTVHAAVRRQLAFLRSSGRGNGVPLSRLRLPASV
jgi:hypothetical protein